MRWKEGGENLDRWETRTSFLQPQRTRRARKSGPAKFEQKSHLCKVCLYSRCRFLPLRPRQPPSLTQRRVSNARHCA